MVFPQNGDPSYTRPYEPPNFDQVWNSLEIDEMITDPSSGYNYEGGFLFRNSPSINGMFTTTKLKFLQYYLRPPLLGASSKCQERASCKSFNLLFRHMCEWKSLILRNPAGLF